MSLAEAKVKFTNQAIRLCFENRFFGPKVNIYPIKGATFEEARKADHIECDFAKSARLYNSLLKSVTDPEEKVWAFGGLVLQLVNARAFRQAREFIKETPPQILPELPEDRLYFLEADTKEKEGRLEAAERGYFRAIECFLKVKEILNGRIRGGERWTIEDAKAFSTADHELGVLMLRLAEKGIDKKRNLQHSRFHLYSSIKTDEEIRGSGVEETVGYGYQRLAENYLVAGDLNAADQAIEEARKHFEAYVLQTPESKIMMGYFAIKNKINSL